MAICRVCQPIPCDNPPDLAAGIDGAIFSALDYSFIVSCPDTCYCPPGLFPQTISILASTIPPIIPPINEPGAPIVLRLQGCSALITRTLDSTATQAQILAAAQSMQAEWAGQQALCNALLVPGVNCNTGSGSISVCNDQRQICCVGFGLVTITAGQYCESLNITGLNQAQIDSATAALKVNLNALALGANCFSGLKLICGVTVIFAGVGGGITNIDAHNLSATDSYDTSSFQLCNASGGGCLNSVQPSVAPGTTLNLISASPVVGAITVKYQGQIIFSNPANGTGLDRRIIFDVNCGPKDPPC